MHLKHRGACSELTACAWLLENGWEVFRNVSAHGLADIVATKGREFIPIDVKTVPDRPFRMRLSQVQVEAGVAALYVHRDGTCTLNLAPEVRCPRKTKMTDDFDYGQLTKEWWHETGKTIGASDKAIKFSAAKFCGKSNTEAARTGWLWWRKRVRG